MVKMTICNWSQPKKLVVLTNQFLQCCLGDILKANKRAIDHFAGYRYGVGSVVRKPDSAIHWIVIF